MGRNKKKNSKQKKATEDAVGSGSDQSKSQQEGNGDPDLSHLVQSDESKSLNVKHCNGRSEFPTENDENLGTGSDGSALEEKEEKVWIKDEARLKMMIKELQLEMESRIQKEAELEMKVSNLQEEKVVSYQKEIKSEEKINQLIREKESLQMQETKLLESVNLLEREKALWIQEEHSIKQKIAALNDDNTRMRVQVVESEESTKQLSLQNLQLMENISILKSRIEDLERSSASTQSSIDITNEPSKIDDLNSQIEAAYQLIEKLITENADLVEKINELYIELGHWQAKDRDYPISVPNSLTINPYETASHPESEPSNEISISTENTNSLELVNGTDVHQKSPEATMSGEIVQIPLNEHEIQDIEGQESMDEKTNDGVPLSDSPLIGAPYRFISFMAKYVSGADLVET